MTRKQLGRDVGCTRNRNSFWGGGVARWWVCDWCFPIVSTNAQPQTKQKGLEAKGSQNLNEWRGKPMNLRAPTWRHTQRWTSPSYSLLLWRAYGHIIAALKEIHNMSSQVILGVCLDSSFCEPPLYIWWTCQQQPYDCNAVASMNAPHKSIWGLSTWCWESPKLYEIASCWKALIWRVSNYVGDPPSHPNGLSLVGNWTGFFEPETIAPLKCPPSSAPDPTLTNDFGSSHKHLVCQGVGDGDCCTTLAIAYLRKWCWIKITSKSIVPIKSATTTFQGHYNLCLLKGRLKNWFCLPWGFWVEWSDQVKTNHAWRLQLSSVLSKGCKAPPRKKKKTYIMGYHQIPHNISSMDIQHYYLHGKPLNMPQNLQPISLTKTPPKINGGYWFW